MSEKPEQPTPQDSLGQPIDDPDVADIFERAGEIDDLAVRLRVIRAWLAKAGRESDPLYAGMDINATVRVLGDVGKTLIASKPYAVTPDDVHERWRQRGWLTKRQHDQLVLHRGGAG